MKLDTRKITMVALLIAVVTVMTYINFPIFPNGGLIHLGYIALFPIAIVFGKEVGAIAGAFGMALFDVLSQWFAWAPATFIIVGIVGYVVGLIANGGENTLRNVIAMVVGSLISIGGYFVFNAFIMDFGVASALTSSVGDALKVFTSTVVVAFLVPSIRMLKTRIQN